MIAIPEDVKNEVRDHWAMLMRKSGDSLTTHGRNSPQYALALSIVTATVSTIHVAYGFKDIREAHQWLRTL